MARTHRDRQKALDTRALGPWLSSGGAAPLKRAQPHWTLFGAWFKRLLRREHRAQVTAAVRRGVGGVAARTSGGGVPLVVTEATGPLVRSWRRRPVLASAAGAPGRRSGVEGPWGSRGVPVVGSL